jgi:hypothetical protein
MQDMKTLWKKGSNIFDGCARQSFNLRAIIFITIHDYQALFILSGQIKGRTGCTVYVDVIISSFLESSRKVVYLGYKRFLVEGYRYRSKKFYNLFDGRPELHSAPVQRDRHYVFNMVRTIQVICGKKKEDGRREREIRHPSMAYHSRSSPSSTSTCHIGRILRSTMQSMVCT